MTRAQPPLIKTYLSKTYLSKLCLLIPLLAAGLLLLPNPAHAQLTVDGPPTPTAHALAAWFQKHIPAKFQAHTPVEVQPFSDTGMESYLHNGDPDSENNSSHSENSADDDEIDGVFVNAPPQIILRIPPSGKLDYPTFAHEYGHYVWFNLLSKDDRNQYKFIYKHQKSAHKLITDYAYESVEEGFAEAFSADIIHPAALRHQDELSYQFLNRWPESPTEP